MNKHDREERNILNALDAGKLKRSRGAAAIQKRHQEYAEAMFRKDARINIRLPAKDLRGLQKKRSPKAFRTRPWWAAFCTSM